jgi:sarcosine oxidase
MQPYDAIVLGLGAMGSAAAWQLARRGARVLGLDQYAPPHASGSSHGDTRITRLAIGEGDHLTPLVLRAHEIWREIEHETGARLLSTTGGLVISSPSRTSFTHVEGFFQNTVAAARKYGIAHEMLDASGIRQRFSPFRVRDDEVGYLERDAGFLRPETCIAAQLALAERHGAELHKNERAIGFEETRDRVAVETERGRYVADRLVVTAGAWLPQLVPACAGLFRVYRQVLTWFALETGGERYAPERFPVFIWELQKGSQGIYGFPAIGGAEEGFKIASETYGNTTTADDVNRRVGADEIASLYAHYVAPNFDGVSARCLKSTVCLYTVTPDFGFVIDRLPGSERVLIASACSGHGFKHSASIGEILADLTVSGRSRFDVAPFRFARFTE